MTEWNATVESDDSPWCGTMRIGIYREIAMNEVLSLLHPQRLQARQKEIEKSHRTHLKTLTDWTNANPEHKKLIAAYEAARDAFVPTLEQRYATENTLSAEEASLAAKLWTMATFNAYFEEDLRCLGRWSPDETP